jgi:hypothetical protein
VGRRSLKTIAHDEWVLRLLDTPRTSVEISDLMIAETREAWAEREGVTIDWESDPSIAKLLAWSEAREAGLPPLHYWDVYRRLVSLEKRGEVERIQLPGVSILWRKACSGLG